MESSVYAVEMKNADAHYALMKTVISQNLKNFQRDASNRTYHYSIQKNNDLSKRKTSNFIKKASIIFNYSLRF